MVKVVENSFGTVCVQLFTDSNQWIELPTLRNSGYFNPLCLGVYENEYGICEDPMEADDFTVLDSKKELGNRMYQLFERFDKANYALMSGGYNKKDGTKVLLTSEQKDVIITKTVPFILYLILKEIGFDEVPKLIVDEYLADGFIWPNPPKSNNLTHKLYESPHRDRNEEKYGHLSGNQCICCMKPLKDGETKWVHMNTDWLAVDKSVSEEECEALTGAGSQGCFNIGNSCAKNMPDNFIFDEENVYVDRTN